MAGNVDITAGGHVNILSGDGSIGPVFQRNVAIDSNGAAQIYSMDSSAGPVFKGNVAIDSDNDIQIYSLDFSAGPVFKGDVAIDSASAEIYSRDFSAGPVFKGDVAIDADGEVFIAASNGIYSTDDTKQHAAGIDYSAQSVEKEPKTSVEVDDAMNGLKFEENVTINADGDVTIRDVSTFSGRVDIVMRDRIDQTRDDVLTIIDSLFKGDLRADGRAGNNTLVESGNTFLGKVDFLRFS